MAVSTEWKINTCDFHDTDGFLQAIKTVHASCRAVDGEDATPWRNTTFPLGDPGEGFVAFDALTAADLMGMVDADEKAEFEASAETALAEQLAKSAANEGRGLPAAITAG